MAGMPVLTAQDLQKAFGPHRVLDGVSLAIDEGERVGLVGVNGSGKSTLARILAGLDAPDGGEVVCRRDATVAYLAQDPVFDQDATVLDVAVEGLGAWAEARSRHLHATDALTRGEGDVDALVVAQNEAAVEMERLGGWNQLHRAEAILAHLGMTRLDAKVAVLSGGERRRIALARILVADPALAILDEPTNHLDVEAIEWLERYLLEEHRGALLLITHDRYVLDRVARRTLELAEGRVYSYQGGYGAYLEAKAERLAHEARSEANRQNFLRREIAWLRRGPPARTTKQKARIDRAEAAIAVTAPKLERTARIAMDATRAGKTVIDLRDLTLTMGDGVLVTHLDLSLVRGERLGIIGKNGTGKTTLLRAILGEVEPAGGSVVRGARTEIAYFDQGRITLDDDASIFDNVAEARAEVTVDGRSMDVRTYLEGFLFPVPKQRQKVASLSGGERARVALAKMMRTGANLVMFDEPTNDLDVATLGALEEMLLAFGGTAIVVSHDRWFLDRVATAILAFEGDGRVVHQPGNYETYRALRAARVPADDDRAEQAPATPAKTRPAAPSVPLEDKPLTYGERIELEGLMERVEAAEARVTDIEARLADPAFYTKAGEEVSSTLASLEQAQAEVADLIARWEHLEGRREATA